MACRATNSQALRDLLLRLHPEMDVDAIIDALARNRAAARALPEMSVSQLSAVLPQRTAELIHTIPGIARAMLRGNYPEHPIIGTFDEASRFLRGCFLGMTYEHCHLLLLRKNRYVIADKIIQSGTLTAVPFYIRNIVETALAHQADALIISHNHPGGLPFPSEADVQSTYSLMQALQPLSIPLLDHIIIAGNIAISLRQDRADKDISELT